MPFTGESDTRADTPRREYNRRPQPVEKRPRLIGWSLSESTAT
jgi:hypothetical protein